MLCYSTWFLIESHILWWDYWRLDTKDAVCPIVIAWFPLGQFSIYFLRCEFLFLAVEWRWSASTLMNTSIPATHHFNLHYQLKVVHLLLIEEAIFFWGLLKLKSIGLHGSEQLRVGWQRRRVMWLVRSQWLHECVTFSFFICGLTGRTRILLSTLRRVGGANNSWTPCFTSRTGV